MTKQLVLNEEGLYGALNTTDLSIVYALVEATSFETQTLFMERSIDGFIERMRKYGSLPSKNFAIPPSYWNWEERYNWSTLTVGHFFGEEIRLDLKFVLLTKPTGKGSPKGILFYNDENGMVVDRALIRDWLCHWFPKQMQRPDLHTNAVNFHNVLND